MKTFTYLTDPVLAGLFWPGVLVGLAVAVMCSLLSVLVVLKRLSFIGQGISHAAFGGVGLAAILGVSAAAWGGAAFLLFVAGFCLLAAGAIAWLAGRRIVSADTAIGIVLVGSMALGAILLHEAMTAHAAATRPPTWESILFGSITGVTFADAAVAWLVAAILVGDLWAVRRPMLFWAFDEPAAAAFGVRPMRLPLMVLLTLAIVASMRLAGVVLATALLVLPGAIAVLLSDSLVRVGAIALGAGLLGVLGGLVAGFELDWAPGPSIVGVLCIAYAIVRLARGIAPTAA